MVAPAPVVRGLAPTACRRPFIPADKTFYRFRTTSASSLPALQQEEEEEVVEEAEEHNLLLHPQHPLDLL